jgi:hypothetical protein
VFSSSHFNKNWNINYFFFLIETNPYKPTYKFPVSKDDELYNCLVDDDSSLNTYSTNANKNNNNSIFQINYLKKNTITNNNRKNYANMKSSINNNNNNTNNNVYSLVQNGGDIPINGLSKYLNNTKGMFNCLSFKIKLVTKHE